MPRLREWRNIFKASLCSALTILLVAISQAGISAELEVVEAGQQYRIIQVQVSNALEDDASEYQIWYATQSFDDLNEAEMHSHIKVGDTAGLEQPLSGEGFENCLVDGEPAHRDSQGVVVIEPDTRIWTCELTGMLPETDYWFALVATDSLGQRLANAEILSTATGRTDVLDQLPQPADTGRVLLTLSSIVLFFIGLFAFMRWKDMRSGNLDSRFAHLYVAPAITALALLSFYPICYGIWLAFTNAHQSILGQEHFIGLGNFGTVFYTPGFLRVTLFTLVWSVCNVAAHVGFGLLMALVLTRAELKGKLFYRTVLLLPWAVPAYISILAWRGIVQADGLFNSILGTNLDLLSQATSAQALVILVNIWLGIPFMMMSMSGALMGIPGDMYEAAELEGVSPWKQFLFITLPNLKTTIVPLSLLGFIWSFNMFTVIYLITRGNPTVGFGEPGATDILITYVYDVAFQYGKYGVAAAWSVVIFLFLVAFSWVYMRRTKATESAT